MPGAEEKRSRETPEQEEPIEPAVSAVDAAVGPGGEQTATVADLFHRLANVVPDEQEVLDVAPDTPVADALELMRDNGYSQLPIRRNDAVLGAFSYRSLVAGLGNLGRELRPDDDPVEEFMERLEIVDPTEELTTIFDALDRDNAVLVGSAEDLRGIITPMDVLRYFHRLAEPYVHLGEIERALREIVQRSATPADVEACALTALSEIYAERPDQLPRTPSEMTLGDLVSLIRHGRNYPRFAPLLGRQRDLVTPRLSRLPTLRNVVFHFRRDLTDDERAFIGETRNWLLRKLWGLV